MLLRPYKLHNICTDVHACKCARVCAHTHTQTHTHIYLFWHDHVCVSVTLSLDSVNLEQCLAPLCTVAVFLYLSFMPVYRGLVLFKEQTAFVCCVSGTGKTLAAMMTLSRMLTLNPTRPVLFLVDKVLLVLQQARYIITELGGDREFFRYVSGDLPFVHLTDFCSGMAASTFRFYICIEHLQCSFMHHVHISSVSVAVSVSCFLSAILALWGKTFGHEA